MWSSDYLDEDFNVRDGVFGVVTGTNRCGVYLRLENGQRAFAYFGGVHPGTEVLCTVRRKARESWDVLVTIDSVLGESPAVA